MGLQAQSWIADVFRPFFAAVDYVVYSLIKFVLFGVFDLSNLTTSSDLLNGIYTRIYVILGVFMAFKLSFSFFQYIIDPESMVGKSEKSISKLITNVIVMLLALVSIPSILFSTSGGQGLLTRAQNAFLPMVPRLLLGINENSGVSAGGSEGIDSISNAMAIAMLQAFYAPSPELDEACGAGTYDEVPNITSLDEFIATTTLTCSNGLSADLGVLGSYGAPLYYKYTYSFLISTVVGILMLFMLLGITIDVAKRVFKMIILEAIAPVPIMSLIDPKAKKDGAFAHWLKSLISTFLDIFIKLGILYLVLTLIQLIINKGLFENFPEFSGEPLRTSYLIVILILGLIFFAKEAPKFIKEAIGVKDSGGSSGLNAGFNAALGAVGGLTTGGLAGFATGAMAGATADPKVGGFAAGRDLAGQIRTGDKNYKGGFANTMLRASTKHQNSQLARRMGITRDTVAVAKARQQQLAGYSADAQNMYDLLKNGVLANPSDEIRDLVNTRHYSGYSYDAATGMVNLKDNNGAIIRSYDISDAAQQQQVMYAISSEAQAAADKAAKNYEKGNKILENMGLGMSNNEKLTMSNRRKSAYNTFHASRANVDKTNTIIDKAKKRGAWTPGDSANSGNVDKV